MVIKQSFLARWTLALLPMVALLFFVLLAKLWYANTPQINFHFFDDSTQWLGLDKIGHAVAAFWQSALIVWLLKKAHLFSRKLLILGSLAGFFIQLPIEILDGFSPAYGASWFDVLANGAGCLLFLGQLIFFKSLKVMPKFSFLSSNFAALRPEILGANLPENILKDYNGHTYWLSFQLNSLLRTSVFPDWLLLAVGYGGNGLLGGQDNLWEDKNQHIHDFSSLLRTTQWYISLDINVGIIQNRFFKFILLPFVCLKFPFPTLEFNQNEGFVGHWF